jgi:hypothetical protein
MYYMYEVLSHIGQLMHKVSHVYIRTISELRISHIYGNWFFFVFCRETHIFISLNSYF